MKYLFFIISLIVFSLNSFLAKETSYDFNYYSFKICTWIICILIGVIIFSNKKIFGLYILSLLILQEVIKLPTRIDMYIRLNDYVSLVKNLEKLDLYEVSKINKNEGFITKKVYIYVLKDETWYITKLIANNNDFLVIIPRFLGLEHNYVPQEFAIFESNEDAHQIMENYYKKRETLMHVCITSKWKYIRVEKSRDKG